MKMNQRIPKLPNVEQINTQQIQRRAAKTSVSFIELLEKQHGYDDDLDSLSLASSNGSDYMKSKNKDLDFLNSSGYLNEKKERRRKLRRKKKSSKNKKKNKSSSKVHKMSSFDMPSIEYDGDTIEVPCYPKLVVSFDAPTIAPNTNPNFLEVQTAWIETPDRSLRKIRVTTESLNGTGLGFTPSNIVDDDIYSGSSSSDSSDDEGGDNTKKNKNNNDNSDDESSNSDMMSLHSDVSSDDFNNDAMDVEKMLQLDRLD